MLPAVPLEPAAVILAKVSPSMVAGVLAGTVVATVYPVSETAVTVAAAWVSNAPIAHWILALVPPVTAPHAAAVVLSCANADTAVSRVASFLSSALAPVIAASVGGS